MQSAKLRSEQARALTSEEAAEVLGVSPETLPSWRSRGKGPRYVRLGRAVRYLESDLAEYLQRNAIDPEER